MAHLGLDFSRLELAQLRQAARNSAHAKRARIMLVVGGVCSVGLVTLAASVLRLI